MILSAAVAVAEARMGKPGEKYYSGRSRVIMERAYIAFKSSTWMIVISGFVEPVLFLLSFGYGLKDLVGDITVNQLAMLHLSRQRSLQRAR
jgi:lipooligosaccharide transport system permease protein